MCWLNSPFLAKTPESVGPEDKMSCHASSRLDKFDKQGRLKIGEPKIQWLIMNIWTGFSLLSQKKWPREAKKISKFQTHSAGVGACCFYLTKNISITSPVWLVYNPIFCGLNPDKWLHKTEVSTSSLGITWRISAYSKANRNVSTWHCELWGFNGGNWFETLGMLGPTLRQTMFIHMQISTY